jgi:hypothetical protein
MLKSNSKNQPVLPDVVLEQSLPSVVNVTVTLYFSPALSSPIVPLVLLATQVPLNS